MLLHAKLTTIRRIGDHKAVETRPFSFLVVHLCNLRK
jgi:hypothetical protein